MYYLNNWIADPTHPIKVLLVGVGGTGSHLAVELINLSFILEELDRYPLDITLADGDKVESHNVGRQKFYPCDIGLNKAEVMTTRINRSFNCGMNYYDKMITKKYLEENKFNIIISAVDNVRTRRIINNHCKKNNNWNNYVRVHYWIDCGNSEKSGQIIMGAYGEVGKKNGYLPSIIDLHPKIKDKNNEPSCSMRASILKQGFMINKWTAIMAMEMLSSLLLDFAIDYNQVYFNLEEMNIKTNKI